MPGRRTPLYLVYDGTALEGPLYRIVVSCPPTLEDFHSYEALGQPYDRRDFFKGTGVSMHTTRSCSVAVARRYRRGPFIAALDLRARPVVWARTGGPDHVTVWAAPEILLAGVVQCESRE